VKIRFQPIAGIGLIGNPLAMVVLPLSQQLTSAVDFVSIRVG